MKRDVLIIGAGISGLTAAAELVRRGKSVLILEARERLGGRIYTLSGAGFSYPVEAGAEFVHGELPGTQRLLKKAGITLRSMEGRMYRLRNGSIQLPDDSMEDFPLLLSRLEELQEDITLKSFLDRFFSEQRYRNLRETVIRYAEGYDASDIRKVSSFALRDEWKNESQSDPYRPTGGYGNLVAFLEDEVLSSGLGEIITGQAVKEIRWQPGNAEARLSDSSVFSAPRILITLPAAIMAGEADAEAYIKFSPDIPQVISAYSAMGLGAVIKIVLQFRHAFWETSLGGLAIKNPMPGLAFLISDSPVGTWWTQIPEKTPLLTGWIAGPNTNRFTGFGEEEIIALAFDSLSYIFGTGLSQLRGIYETGRVFNWQNDPFSLSAYTYATVESNSARELLMQPVGDTLFFAGEAVYKGPAMGTVEAAIESGLNAARKAAG